MKSDTTPTSNGSKYPAEQDKPSVSHLRRPPIRHRFTVKSRLGLHEVPSESALLEVTSHHMIACPCGRTIYIAHPITPSERPEHLLWTCNRCQQPHRITLEAEPGPREVRKPQPITEADIKVRLEQRPDGEARIHASMNLYSGFSLCPDVIGMDKQLADVATLACVSNLEASVFGHIREKAKELSRLFHRYRQLAPGIGYGFELHDLENGITKLMLELIRIGFAEESKARVIDP